MNRMKAKFVIYIFLARPCVAGASFVYKRIAPCRFAPSEMDLASCALVLIVVGDAPTRLPRVTR